MKLDYEKDVTIDQFALDLEWVRQPALTLHYGQAKAEADALVDECKEDLDLRYAKLDKVVREELAANGKFTETMVQAEVRRHESIQRMTTDLINAKCNAKKIQAACNAIDAKKSALENLVKLHNAGYFAEPQADIEGRAAINAMSAKGAAQKIKRGMSSKKKVE